MSISNAPQLPQNLEWRIIGQLHGRAVRQCPVGFSFFQSLTYLGQSGDFHHVLADKKTILVLGIKFKSPEE